MDRVYESNAAASPPSPPATPSSGYPTAGDPANGIPATKPGDYWYHMITESLVRIIEAAGLTPDHTDLDQLLSALKGGFGLAESKAGNGYVTLPGGLIIQWGTTSIPTGNGDLITLPITFPNAILFAIASDSGWAAYSIGIGWVNNSQLQAYARTADTGALIAATIRWIAIGY